MVNYSYLSDGDGDGRILNPPQKSLKGQKADMNQAEVDHIEAKSKGGTNHTSNAQVLSKEENLINSMNKSIRPVFTTRSIITRERALNKVVHDYEDDWQFLNTEEELEVSNVIIVSMEEIFNIDSSLEYLIELMESGTYAMIDDCGKWSIFNLEMNLSDE